MEKIYFDPFNNCLSINGIERKIGARDALVLLSLLEMNGEVATKKFIMEKAWSDVEVTETSLTKSISTLRNLIQEFYPDIDVIITVPRVGYKIRTSLFTTQSSEINATARQTSPLLASNKKEMLRGFLTKNEQHIKGALVITSLFFYALGILQIINSTNFKKNTLITSELKTTKLKNGNVVYYTIKKEKLLEELGLLKCKCTFFATEKTVSVFDQENKKTASFLFDYSSNIGNVAATIHSKMGIEL